MLNQHKVPLAPDLVRPRLKGRFGEPYLWSASCSSTQDALREGHLVEGAVAVTEHQTAGRGRVGRVWDDRPGTSLLVSVVLTPPDAASAAQLSLVCALAIAGSVEATIGRHTQVKWPNDVLVDGRKVAGILLEGRGGAVVCGIGVNVNQTESELPSGAPVPAGSFRTLTGREHDRVGLLVDVLERLEARYDSWLASGLAPLLPELERRDALCGRTVVVGGVSGAARGIAPDGRLRVAGVDGRETLVASGEVASDPSGSDPEGV